MISADDGAPGVQETQLGAVQRRKEKRKTLKKLKRKEIRKKLAILEREEEEALANDPEAQLRIRLREQEEREAAERERKAFEERERLWLQAIEEDRRKRVLEESNEEEVKISGDLGEDDDCEYVEEGPAEIIWKGNEIIVKKKKIKVPKPLINEAPISESHQSREDDRPTSNPLPPPVPTQETLDDVAQQVPNFGTEQDKAHCPFHLKTGACRFGARCSRVHFYPDKSSTLLIKNMYTGPGLSWDHDEGLEFTEEEVERSYEEFYEDVHTEFLKFGELVNFKVCRNSSSHLRGNVYIHYKNLESSILAYNALNGRYYAGKQITCEFVTISRWKIAICGEYMKSRLKNCSRGSVCNFIHCFYNPGGDYEWANWDKPPPKYWRKRMAALFGTHDDMMHDDDLDRYDRRSGLHNKASPSSSGSSRDDPDETRDLRRNRRRRSDYTTKWERSSERSRSHYDDDDGSSASRYSHDSSGEILKGERDRVSSSSGVERTKKRGHLDADNNGRQTRKHRRREKIPTEKTKKHRDNHGRRKLDRSSDHGQIIGDGYHRNRN